ncbi:MAG: hypothetical protein K2X71_01210 [Methylobacterium sp.]|nr:hypothetical protein [Methylobacterium sp.]
MRDMIALRSTRSAALAAALAFMGLLSPLGAATAVRAQGFYGLEEVDAVLAPRAVLGRFSRDGYRAFSHPRFDGEVYTLDADSPWGNRVRLVVDARSGRLLDRERIEAPLYPPGTIPGGRRPGYGWTEADVRVPPASEPIRDPALRSPYRGELTYGREAPMEERRVATRPGPLPSDRPDVSRVAPAAPAAPAAPSGQGGNPLGLNPDSPEARGARRPETPRKVAKPAKPVESPAALIEPKPAAPVPEPKPAPAEAVAAASPPPAAKPADAGWKSPPDGNRPVRVIGGITPVPGKDEAK